MATFPDATTTGVRDGVTLTPSGDITINTAGAVVSGLNITGNVFINAPDVTLVDCRVTGEILIGAPRATIQYVDVIGHNTVTAIDTNPSGAPGGGDGSVIQFCDISQAENGIWLESNNVLIANNYIHNLFSNTGNPDPHIDGIQIPGHSVPLQNDLIQHNNIDLDVSTANSTITMAHASNIDIIDNRLSGGTYTIYLEETGGGNIDNNVFGAHLFGYIEDTSPVSQEISGNIDEATGQPISDQTPPPGAGSISINDVTTAEGNSGTHVDTFTVTRTGGTAAFDVHYATSNGTATTGNHDYVAKSGTLHFGDGVNTQTISVTVNGDTKVEGNEAFNVTLSAATNGATISDNRGVGTITNDDGSSPPPPSNLVANGGFETGNFSGWTLGGNSGGGQIFIDHSKTHAGSDDAAFGSFNRVDGTLTQLVPTASGDHYTLSFWTTPGTGGDNHFEADWNGQTLMDVTNAPNSGYQQHTFDVVGVAGNSTLTFDSYNGPDAWHLDDVMLIHV
jgi:hypothetical protein